MPVRRVAAGQVVETRSRRLILTVTSSTSCAPPSVRNDVSGLLNEQSRVSSKSGYNQSSAQGGQFTCGRAPESRVRPAG